MTSLSLEAAWVAETLFVGHARWEDLLARAQTRSDAGSCHDERVYTFLVAVAYAAAGQAGVDALARKLTGSDGCRGPKLWLEVLPVPPRRHEGNSNLDLALGAIAQRSKTRGGIEWSGEGDAVCFCEMKWDSDLSLATTHDPHRNQLARVIENALCFQAGRRFPAKVYVTLVTPERYKTSKTMSRLYHYKFREYSDSDASTLLRDLELGSDSGRPKADWERPNLAERAKALSLRWVTYEELFEDLPESPGRAQIQDFWARMKADRTATPG